MKEVEEDWLNVVMMQQRPAEDPLGSPRPFFVLFHRVGAYHLSVP